MSWKKEALGRGFLQVHPFLRHYHSTVASYSYFIPLTQAAYKVATDEI